MKKIAIIGGGASGIMAAIAAARGGCEVTLYEQNERIGKKLLATGNGRCNYSNKNHSIQFYYCHNGETVEADSKRKDFLEAIFAQHGNEDTEVFFQEIGMCSMEQNGYKYPVTQQASTVLDVLRLELERLPVRIKCGITIQSIEQLQRKYQGVIVACGSNATTSINGKTNGYELAEALGHTIVTPIPSLVQLRGHTAYGKAVAGVRTKAILTLWINGASVRTEEGELQLTEYGVSGIAVFQLSKEAAIALHKKQAVHIVVNFLPYINEDSLDDFVEKRMATHKSCSMEVFLLGMLHKKLIVPLLKEISVPIHRMSNSYTKPELVRVLQALQEVSIPIQGTNPMEKAQVSSGGVVITELDSHLESKYSKGVYFVGEMVDVDGMCGGYNLQWAWSSGYVAGTHASKH